MKSPSYCTLVFSLTLHTVSFAQIDIYQSDAYSVEEMCAREAEQSTEMDYTEAYEYCIQKNSERPMYQSDRKATASEKQDLDHAETPPDRESSHDSSQN